MKERFEEAKQVATITVGIVTAEVYLDEGGYSSGLFKQAASPF